MDRNKTRHQQQQKSLIFYLTQHGSKPNTTFVFVGFLIAPPPPPPPPPPPTPPAPHNEKRNRTKKVKHAAATKTWNIYFAVVSFCLLCSWCCCYCFFFIVTLVNCGRQEECFHHISREPYAKHNVGAKAFGPSIAVACTP